MTEAEIARMLDLHGKCLRDEDGGTANGGDIDTGLQKVFAFFAQPKKTINSLAQRAVKARGGGHGQN